MLWIFVLLYTAPYSQGTLQHAIINYTRSVLFLYVFILPTQNYTEDAQPAGHRVVRYRYKCNYMHIITGQTCYWINSKLTCMRFIPAQFNYSKDEDNHAPQVFVQVCKWCDARTKTASAIAAKDESVQRGNALSSETCWTMAWWSLLNKRCRWITWEGSKAKSPAW